MLLAADARDLDQVVVGQFWRLRQHRPGDVDLLMPRQSANDRVRGLRQGRKLRAELGQRNARADIGQRAKLDGVDQALEDVAEQRDLLVVVTLGGGQKQRGDAPDGLGAFFGGARPDRELDFVGDRGACVYSAHPER